MEAYVNILSPLDFNFPPFSPTHTSSDPLGHGINTNHTQPPAQPLSPAYAKSYPTARQQPGVVENGQANIDFNVSVKELYELLEGHGLDPGPVAYGAWDATQYAQRQIQTPSQSLFNRHPHLVTYPRPHTSTLFSTSPQTSVLSDSPFTSSSSSSLSSQTCSPWETCPGLAPVSPQVFPSTIAGLRQAQGLGISSASAATAEGSSASRTGQQNPSLSQSQMQQLHGQYFQQNTGRKRSMDELIADVGLSLDTSVGLGLNLGGSGPENYYHNHARSVSSGSFDQGNSFGKMTLQSPIQLTFQNQHPEQNLAECNEPSVGVDGENASYYMGAESASSPVHNVSNKATSRVNSVQNHFPSSTTLLQQNQAFGTTSPLTPVDEKRENALPPISPLSPDSPQRTAHPSSAGVDHSHSSHHNTSLYTRAARRKVSKVDYTIDAFDSNSDGDYEYDDDYDGDEDIDVSSTRRTLKRRRSAGAEGSPYSTEASQKGSGKKARRARSDDDSRLAVDSDDDFISLLTGDGSPAPDANPSPNTGSSSANSSRSSRPRSKPKPKQKSKRRHHCPRPNCHATFTRITDMERHLGSVHRAREGDEANEACRCAFCGKVFSREDAVLRHENDSCPVRVKKRRW